MKGDILWCKDFRFPDGTIVPKFFVVLNEPKPDIPRLIAMTTSQQHEKLDREGCHSAKGYYVFNRGVDFFDTEKTWVLFDTVREYRTTEFEKFEKLYNPERKAALKEQNLQAIINCFRNWKDALPYYRNLLKE